MTIHILSQHETQEILSKLKEQFGIKEIENTMYIERLGVYFAKEQEDGIRLSIEGAQILQSQITKNIYELDDTQLEPWMKGNELNVSLGKKCFVIIKYKDDFLGTGKASENKITNFIPK